ncbi:MAG: hypothetical protein V4820_11505 [Pseudomonadota bacterium]
MREDERAALLARMRDLAVEAAAMTPQQARDRLAEEDSRDQCSDT